MKSDSEKGMSGLANRSPQVGLRQPDFRFVRVPGE
jgi:hypothetical protein